MAPWMQNVKECDIVANGDLVACEIRSAQRSRSEAGLNLGIEESSRSRLLHLVVGWTSMTNNNSEHRDVSERSTHIQNRLCKVVRTHIRTQRTSNTF